MRLKRILCTVCLSAIISSSFTFPASATDCVRTVRAISDFSLQGDAWMWWARAEGVHERDKRPSVGSVLVFKRRSHMNRGHVSLVSRVVDRRTIEVDHSWLDGRGLRRGQRVIDVSAANDWSAVRVWHEPTAQYGQTVYPIYGFILPTPARHRDRIEVAEAPYTAVPPRRAAVRRAPVVVADAGFQTVSATPTRKPAEKPGSTVVTPRRKPTVANAAPGAIRIAALPAHKPQTLRAVQVASRD